MVGKEVEKSPAFAVPREGLSCAEQLSWQQGEEKPSPLTSPFRIQAGRCLLRPNAWVRQSAGVQDPGT